jgi:hypothetical protein
VKKLLFAILAIVIACLLATSLYWRWRYDTFVGRTTRQYTGLVDLRILSKARDDASWFAFAHLSKEDEGRLLHKYSFARGFSRTVLKGKYADREIVDCAGCYYYFDDENGAAYRYLLILVDTQKDELVISEVFGG